LKTRTTHSRDRCAEFGDKKRNDKLRKIYLSFMNEQKKLAFGDKFKKLKKLVNFYHIFHFFNQKGMNVSNKQKSVVARPNSGGAKAWSGEALFGLDFSLVRFFSSMEKK
jgi:hypothetical protein